MSSTTTWLVGCGVEVVVGGLWGRGGGWWVVG